MGNPTSYDGPDERVPPRGGPDKQVPPKETGIARDRAGQKCAENELGVFAIAAYDNTSCLRLLGFHRTETGRPPSCYRIGGQQPSFKRP
jgi:hypothetical protein